MSVHHRPMSVFFTIALLFAWTTTTVSVSAVLAGSGPTISLVPVGTGPNGQLDPGASINGSEITLLRLTGNEEFNVFLEVRIGDWDAVDVLCVGGSNDGGACASDADCPNVKQCNINSPNPTTPCTSDTDCSPGGSCVVRDPGSCGQKLMGYIANLDTSGFTSGLQGTLNMASAPCNSDSDCRTVFGGYCTFTENPCTQDQDCSFFANGERCSSGSTCIFTGFCESAFQVEERLDFVFHGLSLLPCFIPEGCGMWVATTVIPIDDPDPFPVDGFYGGSLVVGVPADAEGTFTLDFRPSPHTAWINHRNELLAFTPVPAKITIGMDCNGNGVVDNEDIANGTSEDCNTNGIPDECDIAAGTETDCNSNGIPDSCDIIIGGSSADCNGNNVPDECEADCNGNGVPDECDVPPINPLGVDCNGNLRPDACDIAEGLSGDCDGNGVPDECDVPPINPLGVDCNGNLRPDACDVAEGLSGDCDGNGVPDECETVCFIVDAPQPELFVTAKNRYLSFVAGNPGCFTGVRVIPLNLPPGFEQFEGVPMWVAHPQSVCENAGQTLERPCGTASGLPSRETWTATLDCAPEFRDWSKVGPTHVFHEIIVPGGSYVIQAMHQNCDTAMEGSFSAPLSVLTSMWGDVVGPFNSNTNGRWGPPDGTVDVLFDTIAVLGKFVGKFRAPIKARADLQPGTPDQIIDILDVTFDLDAFRGRAYPFTPSSPPCP